MALSWEIAMAGKMRDCVRRRPARELEQELANRQVTP